MMLQLQLMQLLRPVCIPAIQHHAREKACLGGRVGVLKLVVFERGWWNDRIVEKDGEVKGWN